MLKSKKTRRSVKRKFNSQRNLRVIGCNANGLASKLNSLELIIKELSPSVICLQETRAKKYGKRFKDMEGYTKFEMVRQNSGGGGLMTLVRPDLKPVWVSEGDDQVEILVVEIRIEKRSIRILNCYAPQQGDHIDRKNAF